jgi:hypothetical protein
MSSAASANSGSSQYRDEQQHCNEEEKPWKKLAHLVLAPKLTFAELRATSKIIGSPPNTPENKLPAPALKDPCWIGLRL